MFTCSWYKIRNFRQIWFLVDEILLLNVYPCIWSTTRLGAFSCHFLSFRMLPIKFSEFQRDTLFVSRNIPTWSFLEEPLYQKSSSTWRRVTSSIGICFWYKIRHFSDIRFLILEIFPLKYFSRSPCIRRTVQRQIFLCHFLESHVILIQNSSHRPEVPSQEE